MNELKQNELIAGELSKRSKLKYHIVGECVVSDTPERLRTGKPARYIELWFTKDLNQCRLFEETLRDAEWLEYEENIESLFDASAPDVESGNYYSYAERWERFLISLTPAQRCEAVLRTWNLWSEENESRRKM